MCEFCPQTGKCSIPWCDNHWAGVPLPTRKALIVPPDPPVTRRQRFAIWAYLVGWIGYFVLVAVMAVRAGF